MCVADKSEPDVSNAMLCEELPDTGWASDTPLLDLAGPEPEVDLDDVVADRQTAGLDAARSQLGVREHGTNAGPEVDEYLASAGWGSGHEWCGAFVSWSMQQAGLDPSLGPQLASDRKALNLFLYQDQSETDPSAGRNPALRALRDEHEAQGDTRELFLVRRPDGSLTPGADYVFDRRGRYDEGVAEELEGNTFTPDELPLQAGDVVVFHGHDAGGHVTMVESYDPVTGELTIVEGNHIPGVGRRTLQLDEWMDSVTGFGRFAAGDFTGAVDAEAVPDAGDALDGAMPAVEPTPVTVDTADPAVAAIAQDQTPQADASLDPEALMCVEPEIDADPTARELSEIPTPHRVRDLEPGSPEWQTRYDLVDRFLDIGFEQGGGSPKENEEAVPAELIEQCVQTGNWDLVILFVGAAEWGVQDVPEELEDPYQNRGRSHDWQHTVRTGKSLTDYDPWAAEDGWRASHGGLGIVHLDSGSLRDLYQITRGEASNRQTMNGMRDRDGNEIPWSGDLVAPDITEGVVDDEVNFDGLRDRWDRGSEEAEAYQQWGHAMTRDRDAQHFLIDMASERFVQDGLFVEEGDRGWQDAYEDPYLRAMYGAVASSTRRRPFERAIRDFDPDGEQDIFEAGAEGANDGDRTRGYAAHRAADLIRHYAEQQ